MGRCSGDDVIVDFCSGGGHVGILLAYLFPNYQVLLVENKEESVRRAVERISTSGRANMAAVQCNLGRFNSPFAIGVGLHACGLVSDLVMEKCMLAGASFVVSPCCYGALRNAGPGDHRGLQTPGEQTPPQYPLTKGLNANLPQSTVSKSVDQETLQTTGALLQTPEVLSPPQGPLSKGLNQSLPHSESADQRVLQTPGELTPPQSSPANALNLSLPHSAVLKWADQGTLQTPGALTPPNVFSQILPGFITYPRSAAFKSAGFDYPLYLCVGHAADQSDQSIGKSAQGRCCMAIVDCDRSRLAEELMDYSTQLLLMTPSTCSPKNHIIVGRAPKASVNG